MITTALSSPGPNSRFLCRPTMEHVHGILLDEKFLYRSVHETQSVKTRSVQDTICSRHNLFKTRFTRHNLFKTHFTMLDEPELPEHEVAGA